MTTDLVDRLKTKIEDQAYEIHMLKWRLEQFDHAMRIKSDSGRHHFVGGVCHCGQKTIDDPRACGTPI